MNIFPAECWTEFLPGNNNIACWQLCKLRALYKGIPVRACRKKKKKKEKKK